LSRLDNAFVRHLDSTARRRIEERLGQVVGELDAWGRRFAFVRRERVVPLSISVAAAAPFGETAALVSAARVSLWIFALDDAIDESWYSADETRGLVRRCCRFLRGDRPELGADPFLDALAEVQRDLARYPLFDELGPLWAGALRGTIDGMIREETWRVAWRTGRDEPPSYAGYVANGRYSIGGPPHVWASIITIGDPSAPRHLPRLRKMERLASTCVRLGNDLRSAEKERREGTLNGLFLLAADNERRGMRPDVALRVAEARVRREIAARVRRLIALRQSPVTRTGRPEAATADIARFVTEFYEAHDYHTFVRESEAR
jgi:hypothetical protein